MKMLGGLILGAALLIAAPAPAAAHADAAAQPAGPTVTREYLLGRWTDNADCSNTVEFFADGRFVTTEGARGTWTLSGTTLTFIGNSTVSARIAATGPNAITLTHGDGSVGHSTRCVGAAPQRSATPPRRTTMPALPAGPAEAVAMSRPFGRDLLIGRWTDDGNCGNVIEFRTDGTFVLSDGGGRWRLEGERLSFIGERIITARARSVGRDRVILIYDDNSLGQSIRC